MTDHHLFETYCAMFANGQLAPPEQELFATHCRECRSCRERLSELSSVSGQLLLHASRSTSYQMQSGALERFQARAVREGIPLRRRAASPALAYAPGLLAMALLLMMLPAILRRTTENDANRILPDRTVAHAVQSQPQLPGITRTPSVLYSSRLRRRPMLPVAATASMESSDSTKYPLVETQNLRDFKVFPTLSRTELRRLDLFHNPNDSLPVHTFVIATLEGPHELTSAMRPFDFAVNIPPLRFQIPTAP